MSIAAFSHITVTGRKNFPQIMLGIYHMHNVFFQKQAVVFKKGFIQTALIADRWKGLLEEVTNRWLILQLDEPLPPLLKCILYLLFPQWELCQGHGLQRVTCCWDHLHWICNQKQLKPLYNLLRFLRSSVEIYYSSCGHPRQVSY